MAIYEDNKETMNDGNGSGHKRRVHYSGTHPKRFEEKYKELQPDKYADTISKVIRKGSTPAGMHISICVKEILDILQVKPGQQGLDCTLGYGGHTERMLEQLNGKGHLFSLDVDPIESAKTTQRLRDAGYKEEIFGVRLLNFAKIDTLVNEVGPFDFILADLGVSSMQIDNPERGFSYKLEGPLDLRLDPTHGISAAERLKEVDRDELAGMLMENSDEEHAKAIAKEVVARLRKNNPIETTTQFCEVIEEALRKDHADRGLSKMEWKDLYKKTCQRSFQALRIDVNSEFEVLEELLLKLPEALHHGGRVAILTFHSGEDRLVKQAFKQGRKEGIYSEISEEVIRPSKEECAMNGRARSAKLRYAVKA